MTDSARTDIIARVRRASQGAAAQDIDEALNRLGPAPQVAQPGYDLAEDFIANVQRNQGSAVRAQTRSEATKAVADFLYQQHRTRKLVAGTDPRLAAMPWRDGGVLPRFGAAEEDDLASVSYARLGVAGTGSIVTWSGKANPAGNNFLVETHIVLVDLDDLVATMEQAWERIHLSQEGERRPRAVNFISGPSSTADIDMQLILGAHGPRSWHVILIGNLPDSAADDAP
jgi:L-lactate dehydrogenase complex protein LldG